MNLWDELANNTVCEGPRQLEDDLAYYLVCDTLDRDVEGCRVLPRTVLLCESPHTDEVIHGHPLAGHSGLNVTKFLSANSSFDHAVCPVSPIGCLVLKGRHGVLGSLGLMNVSQLPLQSKAYSCSLQRRYSQLFGEFEAIRDEANKGNGDSKLTDKIDGRSKWKALGNELCRRLMALSTQAATSATAYGATEGSIEVVPCGAVARGYLCWARRHSCLGNLQPYASKVCHPTKWGPARGLATESEQEQIRALVNHICARSN